VRNQKSKKSCEVKHLSNKKKKINRVKESSGERNLLKPIRKNDNGSIEYPKMVIKSMK